VKLRKRQHLCNQCESGVDLGAREVKTFDPNCYRCQRKKREGLRTGNEPHPRDVRRGLGGHLRMSDEAFKALQQREAKRRAARRAYYTSSSAGLLV